MKRLLPVAGVLAFAFAGIAPLLHAALCPHGRDMSNGHYCSICQASSTGAGNRPTGGSSIPSAQDISNSFNKGFNASRDRQNRMAEHERAWREEDRFYQERLADLAMQRAAAAEQDRQRAEQLAREQAALLSQQQQKEEARLVIVRQELEAAKSKADIEEYQALLRLAENMLPAKEQNSLGNIWPGWKKQAADLAVSLAAKGVPTAGLFSPAAIALFPPGDSPLENQQRRLAAAMGELTELEQRGHDLDTREIRAKAALDQKRITETEYHDRMAGIENERGRYMKQKGEAEAKSAYAEWQRARLAGETGDTTPPFVIDTKASVELRKGDEKIHEAEAHRAGIGFRQEKLDADIAADRLTPGEASRRQGMIDDEKPKPRKD